MNIKNLIQRKLRELGYEITRLEKNEPGMEDDFKKYFHDLKGLHLQSSERLYALYQSIRYVIQNQIEGAFVECGVYKGASAVLAAQIFKKENDLTRQFFLYDTFEGWPQPSRHDPIQDLAETNKNYPSSVETVKQNLSKTGYPQENFHLIKGKVEDTIPAAAPDKIALLRLDTDWYESTYHELVHLYPRLVKNGVLIIDDYGHWEGARKAVDQYFKEQNLFPILQRIDYTGRLVIKTHKN